MGAKIPLTISEHMGRRCSLSPCLNSLALALMAFFFGSAIAADAHVLRFVNAAPGASVWVGSLSYPVGVTVFDLASAPDELLSALATDAGVALDRSHDYTVCVQGASVFVGVSGEANLWPATLSGLGIGFLWFGFGWQLRLAKRVADF